MAKSTKSAASLLKKTSPLTAAERKRAVAAVEGAARSARKAKTKKRPPRRLQNPPEKLPPWPDLSPTQAERIRWRDQALRDRVRDLALDLYVASAPAPVALAGGPEVEAAVLVEMRRCVDTAQFALVALDAVAPRLDELTEAEIAEARIAETIAEPTADRLAELAEAKDREAQPAAPEGAS